MATKKNCSPSEGITFIGCNSVHNSDPLFSNLSLNQNNESFNVELIHSKSVSFNKKGKTDYGGTEKLETAAVADTTVHQNDSVLKSRNVSSAFDKKESDLNLLHSDHLIIQDSQEERKSNKKDSSLINSSTLSLHISAYENRIEDFGDEKPLTNKSLTKSIERKSKSLFSSSTSKDTFEIPRQQKDDAKSEPEIMQFKASQKLLDPKQQKNESKKPDDQNEFQKCKDDANKLFKAKKYNESIEAYNQLQLRFHSTLTDQQKAILFSNRCAAYLMLNEEDLTMMAKFDAELVIRLWPTWWRGYFRLGQAQAALKELEAEKSFEKALALNSESKEARDELSAVRAQIGLSNRSDYLNPGNSKEVQLKEAAIRLGIPEDKIQNLESFALKTPGLGDALRGEYYRDGSGGFQQDYKKSFECYMKAANHDIPDAMYNLGRMYRNGFGVKRDYEESMKWLLKAANAKPLAMMKGSGIAEAQHLIGLNYSEGVGVDKDYRKAAEWYEKAVANNFAPSANNLGLLYQEGHGVEKSASKAFNYFKFAAQKGETPPMINLANCYFSADGTGSVKPTKEDIAEGMKWLRIAAEKGDFEAAQELQRRQGHSADTLFLESLRISAFQDLFEKRSPLNYEQFGKYVEEAAKNGSLTAQRHIEIWKNYDDAMKAFKKNDSGGVVAALSKAIQLDHQIAEIPDLFKPVIEKRFESHPNELDAIICFVRINTKDLQISTLVFDTLKRYPDNEYLGEMLYSSCCCLKDTQGALNCAKLALQFHPNSLRLLYIYAVALCQHEDQPSECIEALNAFLAVAPKDNDKVPACHYRKAMDYNLRKDIPNFITSFEAGLAAEKEQLPCFLPYYFGAKTVMEKLYMVLKKEQKDAGLSSKKVNGQASMNPHFERVKLNLQRKLLLNSNHNTFIFLVENLGEPNLYENSILPPNTPKPPSTKDLKKIMLKDMDPKVDKVYNGYFLEARIIDWPIPLTGIASIIEDENGDVHRLAVYNWPTLTGDKKLDIPIAIKDFYPGFKVTIINPYMRLARDGLNVIRVESPEFITIDKTSVNQKCFCCGKEAKILPCSGCILAKYCSKECQKYDWIEFNHKGICKHLKSFAFKQTF